MSLDPATILHSPSHTITIPTSAPARTHTSASSALLTMEGLKRKQMPTSGNRDFYDEVTTGGNYLHNDANLFWVPQSSLPVHHYHKPMQVAAKKRKQQHQEQMKQGRVCDLAPQKQQKQWRGRAPKAVDEDLYKIPPEFLHQKPKSRVVVAWDFLKRCLGLSRIP